MFYFINCPRTAQSDLVLVWLYMPHIICDRINHDSLIPFSKLLFSKTFKLEKCARVPTLCTGMMLHENTSHIKQLVAKFYLPRKIQILKARKNWKIFLKLAVDHYKLLSGKIFWNKQIFRFQCFKFHSWKKFETNQYLWL